MRLSDVISALLEYQQELGDTEVKIFAEQLNAVTGYLEPSSLDILSITVGGCENPETDSRTLYFTAGASFFPGWPPGI